ncbi:MAG: phosphoribosylanthranilate isomerase [Phycisphaerae bacterium]|nr:MAG: phosphoribosylanthranilate isomerase [Phycisphaerae bacterium]
MLPEWDDIPCVIIGMIHLPPLPGSPRYGGDLRAIRDAVLRDVDALVSAGIHGLMIENFGDTPFFASRVPQETVAHMTSLATHVRMQTDLPIGINCLRNDGCAALAIAQACGASFIRVNVLCGARLTDQGVIQGISADLMRLRRRLGADTIKVMADVDVKHSVPLAPVELEHEIEDTLTRGLADALIISGSGTGKITDVRKVARVAKIVPDTPIFVGSGVTPKTARNYLPHAKGLIVGTSFKEHGRVDAPVDPDRVRVLLEAIS